MGGDGVSQWATLWPAAGGCRAWLMGVALVAMLVMVACSSCLWLVGGGVVAWAEARAHLVGLGCSARAL
eukprot:scaffold209644_cov34-Tisochrysis_lutea.AAC.1